MVATHTASPRVIPLGCNGRPAQKSAREIGDCVPRSLPSLNVVAVSFFPLIRFYLVFLLLLPALALHWTFKCLDPQQRGRAE